MRSTLLLTFFVICYISTSFTCINAVKVSNDVTLKDRSESDTNTIQDVNRKKREIESLDNEEYSTPSQDEQEEPGFWDRIIKVALRLFNRFIEWLNSS